jgi:hypothetical protein
MIATTTLLSAVMFTLVLARLRVVAVARQAVAVTHETAAAIREPGLDDRDRERISRRAARQLALVTVSILARTAAAFGVAVVVYFIGRRLWPTS